ncbi:MAG TPA: vWA domain-containing protein [Myxococcota bacterium]|nr:vWA domain-containing protein [Myxococcota bacterium]
MSDRERGSCRLALAAALAFVGASAGAEPGMPSQRDADVSPSARRATLRIDAPAPDEKVRQPDPLVRVRGRVGAELFGADVVVALDVSNSALLASGEDLDGDGVVGVTRAFAEDAGRFITSHTAWTTDEDDSILHAEKLAGQALVEALSARRDRIGVLTYTAQPRIRAPVGSPEQARQAIDAVPIEEDITGTDVARALWRAARLLEEASPASPGRARAIVLCSDGEPTVPPPRYSAKQRALHEASQLSAQGIALYVLAFGAQLDEERGKVDLEFLQALAAAGGGVLVRVRSPARLLEDLPPAEPRPDWLEIVNATSGESARSLRVSPEGDFDAVLPLVPGANELRVEARWRDGRDEQASRKVHYEASVAAAPTERGR